MKKAMQEVEQLKNVISKVKHLKSQHNILISSLRHKFPADQIKLFNGTEPEIHWHEKQKLCNIINAANSNQNSDIKSKPVWLEQHEVIKTLKAILEPHTPILDTIDIGNAFPKLRSGTTSATTLLVEDISTILSGLQGKEKIITYYNNDGSLKKQTKKTRGATIQWEDRPSGSMIALPVLDSYKKNGEFKGNHWYALFLFKKKNGGAHIVCVDPLYPKKEAFNETTIGQLAKAFAKQHTKTENPNKTTLNSSILSAITPGIEASYELLTPQSQNDRSSCGYWIIIYTVLFSTLGYTEGKKMIEQLKQNQALPQIIQPLIDESMKKFTDAQKETIERQAKAIADTIAPPPTSPATGPQGGAGAGAGAESNSSAKPPHKSIHKNKNTNAPLGKTLPHRFLGGSAKKNPTNTDQVHTSSKAYHPPKP